MAWNEPGNSGRDPWAQGSGKKPGDGAPSLDKLLKRIKSRFGKRGAGSTGGLIGGFVALVVALWLLSGFFTIDEKDRGVVTRFGAFSRVVESGLHWRLPWPAERVDRVDVTQIHQAREHGTVLTRDSNLVEVELQIQYNVADAKEYLFNVVDSDVTLQNAASSALFQVAGSTDADGLLGADHQGFGARIQEGLQKILDSYHAGIAVSDVSVQKVAPPEAVEAAFADAIKARDDQERLRAQAHADADTRLPNARAEAAQKTAEATAYRNEAIARAEGDVARFEAVLGQYKKSPKVTRERLYIDTMSEIYANATKVLVDVDKSTPVIYLPLDQIARGAQKAPDAADPAGLPQSAPPVSRPGSGLGQGMSPSVPAPGASSGNTDSGRSRDRGSR